MLRCCWPQSRSSWPSELHRLRWAKPGAPTATATGNAGELLIEWHPVAGAKYYTVGWINLEDYASAKAAGDWLSAFHYATIPATRTSYAVTGLKPGEEYHAVAAARVNRYGGEPVWSEWSRKVQTAGQHGAGYCPITGPPVPDGGYLSVGQSAAIGYGNISLVGDSLIVETTTFTLESVTQKSAVRITENGLYRQPPEGRQFITVCGDIQDSLFPYFLGGSDYNMNTDAGIGLRHYDHDVTPWHEATGEPRRGCETWHIPAGAKTVVVAVDTLSSTPALYLVDLPATQATATPIPTPTPLPTVAVPTLPTVAVPTLPTVAVPTLPTVAVPTLPTVAVPTLPTVAVPTLPTVAVPTPAPTPRSTTAASPAAKHIEEKNYMLQIINAERKKAGVGTVVLGDNIAAQVHAEAALDNCISSHWGVDGLKPYMRYSLADGYQSNAENGIGLNYCIKASDGYAAISSIRQEIDEAMDRLLHSGGHRVNLLDPHHKRVNVGIAWDKYNTAMIQHFEGDYVEYDRLPHIENGVLSFSGTTRNGAQFSDNLGQQIFYDPPPHTLTPGQVSRSYCYDNGRQVGSLRKPTASGYYYTTHEFTTTYKPCPSPYDVPADTPAPSSHDEANQVWQQAYSASQSHSPRSITAPWITASEWTVSSTAFAIKADISEILNQHGDGVYSLILWGKIGDEDAVISQYSIFHGITPPDTYESDEPPQ